VPVQVVSDLAQAREKRRDVLLRLFERHRPRVHSARG
jgi:hypothetical protein